MHKTIHDVTTNEKLLYNTRLNILLTVIICRKVIIIQLQLMLILTYLNFYYQMLLLVVSQLKQSSTFSFFPDQDSSIMVTGRASV